MNPKEIVYKTLKYENPERVARSFHHSDFVKCTCTVESYATDWAKTDEKCQERKDE